LKTGKGELAKIIDKLDIITLSEVDYEGILKWGILNTASLLNFKIPLKEGIIHVEGMCRVHFKLLGELKISIKVYAASARKSQNNPFLYFECKAPPYVNTPELASDITDVNKLKVYCQDCILPLTHLGERNLSVEVMRLFAIVMAYLENFKYDKEVIRTNVSRSRIPSRRSGPSKKRNVVYVRKTIHVCVGERQLAKVLVRSTDSWSGVQTPGPLWGIGASTKRRVRGYGLRRTLKVRGK